MKNEELKQVLKPLIKQCIKEVIFDDGVLSGIITEIVKGLHPQTLVSENISAPTKIEEPSNHEHERLKEENRQIHRKEMEQQRHILAESMGGRFNGINVFENINPIGKAGAPSSGPTAPGSPLDGIDPGDPVVDSSRLGVFGKAR